MAQRLIEIICGNWDDIKRRTVIASIIGKLAVHRKGGVTNEWVVSHIKTGTRIASFSDRDIAFKFAGRINAMIDWDGTDPRSMKRKLTPEQKAILAKVEEMRWHVSFLPTEHDIEHYGDKRHIVDS